MSRPRIRLSGHLDVPEARRAAVAAALDEHVRLSRAEPGCVYFDVMPDPKVPGRWLVDEMFVDRAAFEAHQRRARQGDWGRITAGLARDYVIEEIAP